MSNSSSQPPFFQGIEPRAWTPNRFYRVYVLPSELIFIHAGSAGDFTAAAGAMFGLAGALIATAANSGKKNRKRQEEMDNSSLDELINDHKHNFRVRIKKIEVASLDPPSFWLGVFYQQPNHAGVFRFKYPGRGNVRLVIGSMKEMKKAFKMLPSTLGDSLAVNVQWSEQKKRFLRKK